jgi:superfamily II DNA or RNA helicase
MTTPNTFAPGALVRARGREWVVQPDSSENLLLLRPLGGGDGELTGVYVGKAGHGALLELVEPAELTVPSADHDLGNHLSGRVLRDAVRLGFRSAAGPFRSLARLGVEPRPYQLVPLLMALRLDPVRLLLADDVGVGKTIEACLIARELLDRAEIRRMTVLCPPHLAEQWATALRDQFHLDAALVLSGTAARLERQCRVQESLFERFPVTVVSTDYIKQDHRRSEFLRVAPELVIVDEAHTCADGARGGGQRRHELLRSLAGDPARHLVLVTATPHSGDRSAFRSLLTLLDPSFEDLPEDLAGDKNRRKREAIARHLVQRRRGDIKKYMDSETAFPKRETAELPVTLKPRQVRFFVDIRSFCRELVTEPGLDQRRARVRWWSVLSLLRALSSSPRAAAATLRKRSELASPNDEGGPSVAGKRLLFDLDEEPTEGLDVAPGAQPDELSPASELAKRFLTFAEEADAIAGAEDAKLAALVKAVKALVDEGRRPIVFCRFIETARYLGEALAAKLRKPSVVVVDGTLPHEEREARVASLADAPSRVLVTTDCLSEGINLQHLFDAVIHYDLAWNPTRHEQREGRVDRFGQTVPVVRALTMFGKNDPIDKLVLDVILRKHEAIRKHLGVAVPVPGDVETLERALLGSAGILDNPSPEQLELFGYGALGETGLQLALFGASRTEGEPVWKEAEAREKAVRSLFAHESLEKVVNDDLFRELVEVRRVLGHEADVARFVRTTMAALGAPLTHLPEGPSADSPVESLDLRALPSTVRDALGGPHQHPVVFTGLPPAGGLLLTRTHPFVESLARFTLEAALDPVHAADLRLARRAAVVRTRDVATRTTLLLLRLRCHLESKDKRGQARELLAEDLLVAAFTGAPDKAAWLDDAAAEALFDVAPSANVEADAARMQLGRILEGLPAIRASLSARVQARGAALLDAHRRVREATKGGALGRSLGSLGVRVHEPVDLLGVYVFLPDAGASRPTRGDA